jgi:hypothetical protein
MKLKKTTFKKDNGKTGYSYAVKKLNEYGEGMPVDTPLALRCSFPPKIEPKPNKNKDGTFLAVSLLGEPVTALEDYQGDDEYNNAYFYLPEKAAAKLQTVDPITNKATIIAKKGDIIYLRLRSFEAMNAETGKMERRSTWDVKLNEDFSVDERKTQSIPQVQINTIPAYEAPTALHPLIAACVAQKAEIRAAFMPPDVLTKQREPTEFYTWLMQPEQCETEYFTGLQSVADVTKVDVKAEMNKLFWEIVRRTQ